jgi:hypothetical protein
VEKCKKGGKGLQIEFDLDSGSLIKIDKWMYVLDVMEMLNIKPNKETFMIGLERGYKYSVMMLIGYFDINYEVLGCVVKSRNFALIEEILNRGGYAFIGPDILRNLIGDVGNKIIEKEIKKNNNNKIKIVELLIKYGFKIDLNCIGMLLSANLVLDDLEKFGIGYDENLYFQCYINEYYPKKYMDKFIMDKKVLEMRHHRYSNNINKNIQFLKENGVSMDMYGLEKAIKDGKFGEYLMGVCKCVPSLMTLYKMSMCIKKQWKRVRINKKKNINNNRRKIRKWKGRRVNVFNCGLFREMPGMNMSMMVLDCGLKI